LPHVATPLMTGYIRILMFSDGERVSLLNERNVAVPYPHAGSKLLR